MSLAVAPERRSAATAGEASRPAQSMVAIARRLFLRTLCDSPRPSGHAPSYLSRQRFGSRIWLGPVPAVPPGCPDDASCPPPGLLHEGFTKAPTHGNRPVPLGLKGARRSWPGGDRPRLSRPGQGPPPAGPSCTLRIPPTEGLSHRDRAGAGRESPPPPWAGETHHAPTRTLVRSSSREPSKTVVLCGFSVASPSSPCRQDHEAPAEPWWEPSRRERPHSSTT